jgi:predicted secreted Zn-dependent protease
MDPDILVPLAGMLTGVILVYPVVRTVVKIVERKVLGTRSAGDVDALHGEVAELRASVEEMRDAQDRLLDLEERVDFTERLLAQSRDKREIGEGR